MEYFNRDPGPGTYSENASTVESSLQSEMAKLQSFDGTTIERTFDTKAKRFMPVNGMTHVDPKITVGPGQYTP